MKLNALPSPPVVDNVEALSQCFKPAKVNIVKGGWGKGVQTILTTVVWFSCGVLRPLPRGSIIGLGGTIVCLIGSLSEQGFQSQKLSFLR